MLFFFQQLQNKLQEEFLVQDRKYQEAGQIRGRKW